MLDLQRRVRLLTNNPNKVAALGRHGVAVLDRVPLAVHPGAHDAANLRTTRDRSGHRL